MSRADLDGVVGTDARRKAVKHRFIGKSITEQYHGTTFIAQGVRVASFGALHLTFKLGTTSLSVRSMRSGWGE